MLDFCKILDYNQNIYQYVDNANFNMIKGEKRGRGAPPGGRVHWLQFELSGPFLLEYKTAYNYKFKNYRFYRMRFRTLIDEFIVMRTSRRCYRVMYFNDEYKFFRYFSAKSAAECAEKMKSIYAIFKRLDGLTDEREKKGKRGKNS